MQDKSIETFAHLLEELPVAAVLLDPDGVVLFMNRVAGEFSGERSRSWVGSNLFQEIAPWLQESGLGDRFRGAVAEGDLSLDVDTMLPGERRRAVHMMLRMVRFEGGVCPVCVFLDHTSLEEERERRQRAERMASVGEMAAGLAHEVNNPLGAIKSFAQLLLSDQGVSPAQREALEIIVRETSRVSGIVGQFLTFARHKGSGGRRPVDLNEIIERVLQLHRYALDTAGIELRKELDPHLSPVMGEPGALEQVILNIVVNAEQALLERESSRLLIVRSRESTAGVTVTVYDNGPGIPKDMLRNIFRRNVTTKEKGSGLGLSISEGIIREHGGLIRADSDVAGGTAFYIEMPRAEDEPAPAPAFPAEEAAAAAAPEAPALRPLSVLVADDEPAIRMAVSLALSARGHTVREVADAAQALRLAERTEFDVAVIDARMPGDGLRLLETLERLPALQGRTVLMTGDIGRARTQQGIVTGRPTLTKPFDLNEMIDLVESLAP